MPTNWIYLRASFKLIRPQLGTATAASIWSVHVLEKAKKEIKKANNLSSKILKSTDKFKGTVITESKEIAELKGIIRSYQELIGKKTDLPDNIEELLKISQGLEEEFNELVKSGDEKPATIFIKDKDGWPLISTHMVLGNLKENLKVMVNNGDKTILKTKVSIGETMALDIKPVEEFMRPDKDIVKDANGNRVLCERPIRFNRMGKEETAIAMSEQLPENTTFSCTLRLRADSPINQEALEKLFDFGKNNGFGSWRGSGNKGAYVFKLELLPDYKEDFGDGWK